MIGCCAGDSSDLQIRYYIDERILKILILGTGGAGKSTIIKQMRSLHQQNPFSYQERRDYRPRIHSNLTESLEKAFDQISKDPQYSNLMEDSTIGSHITYFKERRNSNRNLQFQIEKDNLTDEEFKMLETVWNHSGVNEALRNSKVVLDGFLYFMDHLPRISEADYMPIEEDLIRARVRTTGLKEYDIEFKDFIYRFVDVGGQRNERRKWIHCFDNVDALLFVAALSDYDEITEEPPCQLNGCREDENAMEVSIALFDVVIRQHNYFKNSALILFLNKSDKLKAKLKTSPVRNHFEDYDGPPEDADSVAKFIGGLYKARNPDRRKAVYSHVVCAIDRNNMRFVMAALEDYIHSEALKDFRVL